MMEHSQLLAVMEREREVLAHPPQRVGWTRMLFLVKSRRRNVGISVGAINPSHITCMHCMYVHS